METKEIKNTMFRFFENLVDPFSNYQELDNPPNTVRSFLISYTKPFLGIFIITGLVATLAAASEIYLIYFDQKLLLLRELSKMYVGQIE